jgi:hypothetical protein
MERFKPFDIVEFGYGTKNNEGRYPIHRTVMLVKRKKKTFQTEIWTAVLLNDTDGNYNEPTEFYIDKNSKVIYRKESK